MIWCSAPHRDSLSRQRAAAPFARVVAAAAAASAAAMRVFARLLGGAGEGSGEGGAPQRQVRGKLGQGPLASITGTLHLRLQAP